MPIPFVEDCYFYKRKDNVLIACKADGQEVPLIRFKQKFIDINILESDAYKYMERYINMFPDLIELITTEPQGQLNLF